MPLKAVTTLPATADTYTEWQRQLLWWVRQLLAQGCRLERCSKSAAI
jgi:hypothetical protein